MTGFPPRDLAELLGLPPPRIAIRAFAVLLISLAFWSCASAGAAPEAGAPVPEGPAAGSAEAAAATITAEEMRDHIAYLASDELRGRDTPSPGLEAAAEYLAAEFAAIHLEPAGDAGSYVQRFPYEQASFAPSEMRMAYDGPDGGAVWGYASDYFVLPAEVESASGEALFLGPLSAAAAEVPEDAAGRILVVSSPPNIGLELLTAARNASAAGAIGLVLILHPAITPEILAQIAGQLEGFPRMPIPVFGLRREKAGELFEAASLDLGQLEGEEREAGSEAAPLPLEGVGLTLRMGLTRETHTPPNVVALLPGRDPDLRDTYLIFSAHFDHVGVGSPDASGDSIYNGADDDASGTSLLLEVAEAFASLRERPARSILFLAVSGEEKGLLGSRHFVSNPTVPIERVVANINVDMIGRNAPDTVIAVGEEYSSLGPLARRIAVEHPELGLAVAADPDPSEHAFFRSDHVSFVRREIPAIFITSWLHDDYHRPSDEVERIDADKAARVARLVFLLGHAVANDPEPPRWTDWETVRQVLERAPF